MNPRACLLVTPDDALAGRWLRPLRAEGWRAERAASLAEFLARARGAPAGMALVDLRLVEADPAAAVRRLRGEARGWRLVLVAGEASGGALGGAIDSGADDLIPAGLAGPALTQRLGKAKGSFGAEPAAALDDGAIRVDGAQRLAWTGRSRPRLLRLTPKEFGLLSLLVERRGQVVSRQEIIDRVWGGRDVNSETIDRHVGELRRKLGSQGRRIRTRHGAGYAAV